MSDEILDKIVNSTGRAVHLIQPETDRDGELMCSAYVGLMVELDIEREELMKIALGLQYGYKELLKYINES